MARDVEVDIIGRDRFSQAADRAGRGAAGASSKMDKLKANVAKGTAAFAALSAGVLAASRVMDRGLTVALARAGTQVALGESAYRALTTAAEENAHSIGLSTTEFIQAAGKAAILTKNLGFSKQEAAEFGNALPQLSYDLSLMSLGQFTAAEAADSMASALAGEFDPLQRYGIAITAATVAQRANNLVKESGGKLSLEQAKSLAVLKIAQEQTTDASEVAETQAGKQKRQVDEAKAALKEFGDQIAVAVLPALADFTGGLADNAAAVSEAEGAWGKFGALFGEVKDSISAYDEIVLESAGKTKAATDATAEQADTAKKQEKAIAGSGRAMQEAAVAQDRLQQATEKAIESQQEQANLFLGMSDATIGYREAIDDARASVKENGKTLDLSTEKGRKNQEALNKLASSALKQSEAMVESAASASELSKQTERQRAELVKAGQAFGLSAEEARAYANRILGIPKAAATKVKAETGTATAAVKGFEARVAALSKTTARPKVRIDTGPSYAQLAAIEARLRALGARASRVARGSGGQGGITFADGPAFQAGSGGRVGGPSEVNVTTQVLLDGQPFAALTRTAVDAATSRAAWRAKVGRR